MGAMPADSTTRSSSSIFCRARDAGRDAPDSRSRRPGNVRGAWTAKRQPHRRSLCRRPLWHQRQRYSGCGGMRRGWKSDKPDPDRRGEIRSDSALPARVSQSVDDIQKIRILAPSLERVSLSQLSRITLDDGASTIYREGNSRYIAIKYSVRGRDLG